MEIEPIYQSEEAGAFGRLQRLVMPREEAERLYERQHSDPQLNAPTFEFFWYMQECNWPEFAPGKCVGPLYPGYMDFGDWLDERQPQAA